MVERGNPEAGLYIWNENADIKRRKNSFFKKHKFAENKGRQSAIMTARFRAGYFLNLNLSVTVILIN